MASRGTLIGMAIALGLIVLGIFGVLSNPKPGPVTPGAVDATRAAAEKAGAQVAPTANQRE
jgi:hypothetical protein